MYAPQILLKKPITIPLKGELKCNSIKMVVSHKKVLLAPLQIYGCHTCKLLNSRQNMPPVREILIVIELFRRGPHFLNCFCCKAFYSAHHLGTQKKTLGLIFKKPFKKLQNMFSKLQNS